MENKKKDFTIESEIFDGVRENLNKVLTSTVKNMISKQSQDGCITLKIGITLKEQDVPIFGAKEGEPETRKATIPEFKYECNSAIQIKSKTSGSVNDGDELIYDPETDSYTFSSFANAQRSIFDDDFTGNEDDEYEEPEDTDEKLLVSAGETGGKLLQFSNDAGEEEGDFGFGSEEDGD